MGEDNFCFRSPRRSQRKWEQVPVKFGYPHPLPKVPILTPQRSAVIPCTIHSLWSSLCSPQSLVIPVLCPQSLVIP
ncbi:unnamed protein product [Staurois parvus]|uniref:Uncharacterized protein n=1 Tax=Staurois parvus TaxID=386267 RepID=A0ABN9DSS9_9NEOB|nr:unnamed protein product [Staurois parvus]